MRIAAIETSGDWCSAALWLDGEIVSLERRAGQRHSELALPMLQSLFHSRNIGPSDLDAVAFGAGPGSFTGLRIACGIAQGLAFARGLPVAGVSSFEAVAEEAGADRVIACIDARMREVYYAALEKRGGRWVEVVPGRCVAPADAPAPPGDGWVACGSGLAAYPDFLQNRPMRSLRAVHPEVHPTAWALARLAGPRLEAGEGLDASRAAPVYLRDKVALTMGEQRR
jgi:tRNA threonylcarbamoyladenosine biosynthesis protein TsaB